MSKPKQRGRPTTNGMKPGWTVYRAVLILDAYGKYRASGFTHRESKEKAVYQVNSLHPRMPVSVREVDRVLSKYHSAKEEGAPCLIVSQKWEDVPIVDGLQNGDPVKFQKMEVLSFSIGPRPKYPKRKRKLSAINFRKKMP